MRDEEPRVDAAKVEIRRSARRRKTVSARMEGDTLVVLMPAGLTAGAEKELVDGLRERIRRSEARGRARASRSDDALRARAERLSRRYLAGRAYPRSVRWVSTMNTRWGSCTPADGSIRISDALRGVPDYVLDYVLIHELVHLYVPGGHGPDFWEEVRRHPRMERAIGYLEAYSAVVSGRADHRAVAADGEASAAADGDDPDQEVWSPPPSGD